MPQTLGECFSRADALSTPIARTARRAQCSRMFAPHPPPPPRMHAPPYGLYGKDTAVQDGGGWGKFTTFCLVAVIFGVGYNVYRKSTRARGGSGGLGGRGDPREEGIDLLGCMPTRRATNIISDMQARRRDQGLASRDASALRDDDDDAML